MTHTIQLLTESFDSMHTGRVSKLSLSQQTKIPIILPEANQLIHCFTGLANATVLTSMKDY